MTFRELIKRKREEKGLSMRDLAAISGVSNGYISQLENGTRHPSAKIVLKLSESLDIPQEHLMQLAGHLLAKEPSTPIGAMLTSIRESLGHSHQEFAERFGIHPEEMRQLEECTSEEEARQLGKRISHITLGDLLGIGSALSEEEQAFLRDLQVRLIRSDEASRVKIRNLFSAVLEHI